MNLGLFRRPSHWGLLLITEDNAADEVPNRDAPEQQATASPSAVVLKVRHEVDGEVAVRVWRDNREPGGREAFAGTLDVPSGVLRICDAEGGHAIRIPTETAKVGVKIYADARLNASSVDIVLD